jgi:hypothetical protein
MDECHFGPKKLEIPGPNPFPVAQVMDLPAFYAQERINQKCISGIMYKSPGVILTEFKNVIFAKKTQNEGVFSRKLGL